MSALTRTVLRVAIYIRVSSAMQVMAGWSLDAQRDGLTALAQSKGWKVVGVYADEGKTARKRLKDRKAIFRLLDDVKAGKIDIILFKELDRWFRNVSDFYKVQDVLDEYGVEWYSQQQPQLEMRTKDGRLQVNLLLSIGQNETDTTSDRIKYTNIHMRKQKRWTSGASTLPRGYTLDDDQHVIIDREQEPFVRSLIANVIQTGTVLQSLQMACEEHNTTMHYNNAAKLLDNPMLYGAYKEVPDFVANPYLTKAEWDRLQSAITRKARSGTRQYYIFAGLVRCAECNRAMSGTFSVRHGKTYWYYRCEYANRKHQCTATKRCNEAKLEALMLERVQEAVAGQIAHVKAVKGKARPKRKSNRAAIERQLDKLEDVYISSDRMTKEKYLAKREAILAKLVEAEDPEERLPELATLEQIQTTLDSGVLEIYGTFTREERREFWRSIVSTIWLRGPELVDVDFIA